MRRLVTSIFIMASLFFASSTSAQQPEKRIALVIGNAAYQAEALPTAANDAGLIAQTLQAAGFDVLGARDLDQDTLRRTFRDFLEKATASGPDTVAFVYLNGYGFPVWRGGPMFYADTVGLGEVVSAITRYNQLPNAEPWAPAPLLARLAAAGESFSSFDSSNSGSAS